MHHRHFYHEPTAKNERPTKGVIYHWYLNGRHVYTAQVIDYRGACWVTIRIIDPAPEFAELYQSGSELEIKLSHYTYKQVSE